MKRFSEINQREVNRVISLSIWNIKNKIKYLCRAEIDRYGKAVVTKGEKKKVKY